MAKKVTMRDVAKKVGVSHPVVSAVINNNYKSVKVSEATKKRVLEAVKESGYFPNAAARSLSKRRMGCLGFLLSDSVADGLGNAFFSEYLTGIESECRSRGYGLSVSLYNLSNIDNFIFPAKIGERSVDGLILAGFVEKKVVEHFSEFGIPTIVLGNDLEIPHMVATVCADMISPVLEVIEILEKCGHNRIAFSVEKHPRAVEYGNDIINMCKLSESLKSVKLELWNAISGFNDYASGVAFFKKWNNIPQAKRPTALISSDQSLIAFMHELYCNKMNCPQDISLVATSDSSLCEYANPGITAIRHPAKDMGKNAVDILVDVVEGEKKLSDEFSVDSYKCSLIERDSIDK